MTRPGRAGWIGGALATAFGMLLAVALAEAVLRLLVPDGALVPPTRDEFWLPRWQAKSGSVLHAEDMLADPDLGWRMRPGYMAPGVRHDPTGFRRTGAAPPPSTPMRIVAVGDSFAYGLGVRDEETFAALLQSATGIEVVNAGVNGYGIDQAVLMWERHGRPLAPRVVVLTYYVDDFFRNGLHVREGPKPRFVESPSSGLFELLGPQQSLLKASDDLVRGAFRLRLAELTRLAGERLRHRFGWLDEDTLQPLARTSRFLLERLQRSVDASSARLVVVFIGHVREGAPEHRWIEADVMRTCSELGIDCLNMARDMAGPERRDLYLPNAHWSAQGHRVAAAAIARHLATRGGPEFAVQAPPPSLSAAR